MQAYFGKRKVKLFVAFPATMMWSIGMADRDNSGGARVTSVTRVNSEDEEESLESTEGEGPTNEAAENAIRALGSQEEQQELANDGQDDEEEESNFNYCILLNIRLFSEIFTVSRALKRTVVGDIVRVLKIIYYYF